MSDTLSKLNQRNKDLAAKAEESHSFDDDGRLVLPETFVQDNLPEDMTVDLIRRVQDEEASFATGISLALGNLSLGHMQTNPDLNRTTVSLGFGYNTIRASVDREIMTRAPGSTEEKKKMGNLTVKLESGASTKRGDLKRVRDGISENFTSVLGSK